MGQAATLDALARVLAVKVYAVRPNLVRNDFQAATVVCEYLNAIWVTAYEASEVPYLQKTVYQHEMTDAYYEVEPLLGLSVHTIRKYIAVLWREGRFDTGLSFEYEKSVFQRSRRK